MHFCDESQTHLLELCSAQPVHTYLVILYLSAARFENHS